MQQPLWFLGIDGGGTKTEAVLGTTRKKLFWAKAGPSNPFAVGLNIALKNIAAALARVEKNSGSRRPYAAVIGLAGMDNQADFKVMRKAISQKFSRALKLNWRLLNDIQIALASGTQEKFAAAIIAGTGSNAFARGPKGQASAGGKGHILADEGSGYDQGLRALQAVTRAVDGRGRKTLLTKYVFQHFKVRNFGALAKIVHAPGFGKPQIAQLALAVQKAAENGDQIARTILAQAAGALADLAITVIKKAGLTNRRFDLVCVGGIFKCPVVLTKIFRARVKANASKVVFVFPKYPPAFGAWLLAQQ
ncbi:hypothetical protein C4546_00225 [Candidatus Parcubacteria bacterium]|jgi:N-acetylglucosamine kinase|nr:MAG: hypothetical protein C4546_00225 [Candidatus Parcubacteria bacterium]